MSAPENACLASLRVQDDARHKEDNRAVVEELLVSSFAPPAAVSQPSPVSPALIAVLRACKASSGESLYARMSACGYIIHVDDGSCALKEDAPLPNVGVEAGLIVAVNLSQPTEASH